LRYNLVILNYEFCFAGNYMPIYEYRCESCGSKNEHLQKISDKPIFVCPACGSNTYTKLVSAAGFHLKGSGWYATDFKNNSQPKPKDETRAKKNKATSTTSEVAPKNAHDAAPAPVTSTNTASQSTTK
jgi:putative FmdB family regulatory protein